MACVSRQGEHHEALTLDSLRYTFTDLVQLANADAVVRRALMGHVTEEMQRHCSSDGLDEQRAAIAGVLRLVPASPAESGVEVGAFSRPDKPTRQLRVE